MARRGRDDAPHCSTSLWYALGDDAETRLRDYAFDYLRVFSDDLARAIADTAETFTPAAVRDAVAAASDAGFDELFLVPTTTDPDELTRTRDALGV